MTGHWEQIQIQEAGSQTFTTPDNDEFVKGVARWLMAIGKIPTEKNIIINGKLLEV